MTFRDSQYWTADAPGKDGAMGPRVEQPRGCGSTLILGPSKVPVTGQTAAASGDAGGDDNPPMRMFATRDRARQPRILHHRRTSGRTAWTWPVTMRRDPGSAPTSLRSTPPQRSTPEVAAGAIQAATAARCGGYWKSVPLAGPTHPIHGPGSTRAASSASSARLTDSSVSRYSIGSRASSPYSISNSTA